jgi:hypothetical protein
LQRKGQRKGTLKTSKACFLRQSLFLKLLQYSK